MISETWEKKKDPQYRRAFVASQINIGIPFQIRALLKSRSGWTQETLAERTGMLQPRISGLMTPGRTRPNIETLRRIAEAFDCGLLVRFVPFSDLAWWSEEFDPECFYVPSFADDAEFVERKPVSSATLDVSVWEEPQVASVGNLSRTAPDTAALNMLVFPSQYRATGYRTIGGSTNA